MSLRSIAGSAAVALALAACVSEVQETPGRPWDAGDWREQLRMHAESVEPLLPLLRDVHAASDLAPYSDTLRAVYGALRAAEETVPRVAWEAELRENALHFHYDAALRELRYGAEVLLEVIEHNAEERRLEGRYYLGLGLEHIDAVIERLEGR